MGSEISMGELKVFGHFINMKLFKILINLHAYYFIYYYYFLIFVVPFFNTVSDYVEFKTNLDLGTTFISMLLVLFSTEKFRHAVVLTGHNTTEGYEKKEEWEKIKYCKGKNSWGPDWVKWQDFDG